jgi:xylulokinase
MLKEHLEFLGADCNEIRSMGGGAQSPLWCQIKADVCGKKIVTLQNSESACLGSAIIAGVGTGVYKSVKSACRKLIKTGKEYYPGGIDYSEPYERYIKYEEANV